MKPRLRGHAFANSVAGISDQEPRETGSVMRDLSEHPGNFLGVTAEINHKRSRRLRSHMPGVQARAVGGVNKYAFHVRGDSAALHRLRMKYQPVLQKVDGEPQRERNGRTNLHHRPYPAPIHASVMLEQ